MQYDFATQNVMHTQEDFTLLQKYVGLIWIAGKYCNAEIKGSHVALLIMHWFGGNPKPLQEVVQRLCDENPFVKEKSDHWDNYEPQKEC